MAKRSVTEIERNIIRVALDMFCRIEQQDTETQVVLLKWIAQVTLDRLMKVEAKEPTDGD